MLSILAHDKSVILYRKELNQITGGVTATLLLSQIIYWHSKGGAFYKFNKPCNHPLYRAGDSWEEELGLTTGELRSAMTKLKDAGFVSSHTDSQRLTKYTLHADVLNNALSELYNQQQPIVKSTKANCKINNNQLLNCDLPLYTETTTETTTDIIMSCSSNIDQLPSQPPANQLAKNQRTGAAKQLLEYLNTQANRQYRPTPSNLKLITSRLDEGYTPDDIARVIERKCEEWLSDSKMVQYLRPSTLFNATKFNSYVGQLSAPLPTNNNKSSNGLAADDLSWMNGMDEML